MSTHRALRASLALAFLTSTCLLTGPIAARAQAPDVDLSLRSQTPFTTVDDPELELRFLASNTGDTAIDDLSVGFSIGPRVISRDLYERTLEEGPGPFLISAVSQPQEGTLEPGQERTFDVRMNVVGEVPEIASAIDSAVYPAQVDLRSRGVPIATLNTALIHLARTPERPMLLSWWAELSGPTAIGPDGTVDDPALEGAIAPGGTLGAEVAALARVASDEDVRVPLDVVVEPALLDQLDRLSRGGYERSDGSTVTPESPTPTDAGAMLRALRDIASGPDVQVAAMPFAAPLLPAMVSSGLREDLDRQRDLGDATVQALLDRAPTTAVERPPGGAIDDAALEEIAARGVGAVLANADTVERGTQLNDFAPPPAASLTTTSGTSIALVLPDPGVAGLLSDPRLLADPVRGAQAVLGEIAAIWREQPVPAEQPDGSQTVRGIAIGLPAGLPAALWTPLLMRLAGAPFLAPMHGQDFVERVNPLAAATSLASPSELRFSRGYVQAIRDERRRVDAFRSMLLEPDPQPDRLARNLLYAEGGEYIGAGEASGIRWVDQVNASTAAVFARAAPVEPQAFTLTSTEGSVPLRMGDPGDVPLRVQIQLRSSKFDFPDGNEQTVTLTRPDQIVTFTVRAKAAGAQTITVRTRAPSGRTLDQRNLAVRSTGVNGIALAITGAAALVLALLWSRRYIRRPRS
jgi:hypothetical protein